MSIQRLRDQFGIDFFWIQVREEILACYELVERLGRGAVYLGSSRVPEDHAHFRQAQELSRQVMPGLFSGSCA
jgi:hypothetical protein